MKEHEKVQSDKEILSELKSAGYMVVMDLGRERLESGWWPLVSIKQEGGDLKIYGGDGEWHVISPFYATLYRKAYLAKKLISE